MVGCIKMKLHMQVGLGPGHIVLDGDPAPLPQRGTAPLNFRPISVAAKISLGMELDLGTGDFVFPLPPKEKGERSPQILGPCLLWPNGWMDEAGT